MPLSQSPVAMQQCNTGAAEASSNRVVSSHDSRLANSRRWPSVRRCDVPVSSAVSVNQPLFSRLLMETVRPTANRLELDDRPGL